MQTDGIIDLPLIRFCVVGSTTTTSTPKPDEFFYLSDKQWNDLCELNFEVDIDKYMKAEEPELLPSKLNLFQKVVIIKILRPERFIKAITNMIMLQLGKVYLEYPQVNLETVYKESTSSMPILIIIS